MNIVIYPLLGTTSRRAMLREKSSFDRPYTYRPRGNLLIRLSKELGMPVEEVTRQIARERQHLLGK
ncbi:hypothetical protein [Microcoleus sp. Pol12B5]|uniref:hypothetical protein n=1 Tax=Microcoleus sp. Pol12B5 TaxID=3055396 RepID=UPI002FD34137